MKDPQFEFRYSWRDLRPVCVLTNTVAAFQIIGAVCGYSFIGEHDAFSKIWTGAALATFPGFVIGYLFQKRVSAEGLAGNGVMVGRFGLIALFLTMIAIVTPLL